MYKIQLQVSTSTHYIYLVEKQLEVQHFKNKIIPILYDSDISQQITFSYSQYSKLAPKPQYKLWPFIKS